MQSIKTYKRASSATTAAINRDAAGVLFHGECEQLLQNMPNESIDLIISSPPYCMGKEYESNEDIAKFRESHSIILPELVRVLKPGGSLCWQVGTYVRNGIVTPLDYLVYGAMMRHEDMLLRNRIVWTFGHGLHCSTRFSGRHETILWFTKGNDYSFDLDAIRVSQKYPGKTHSKGPNKGKPSGNPLGKNPGDVWEIPNVKANHIEKTAHPCQFPVGLAHRLVRALSKKGDLVFDPFCGSASTGVAAIAEERHFLGAEVVPEYIEIGLDRLSKAVRGEASFRPAEQDIHVPKPTDKVAVRPDNFQPKNDNIEIIIN